MRAVRGDVKRCAVRPGGARVLAYQGQVPVRPALAYSRTKAKSPSDPRSRARVLRYTRSRPGMSGQKKPAFRRVRRASGLPLIVNRESDSRSQRNQR